MNRRLLVVRLLLVGAGLSALAAVAWRFLLQGSLQILYETHFRVVHDPDSLTAAVHRLHVYGVFLAGLAVALVALAAAVHSAQRLDGAVARWERNPVVIAAGLLTAGLLAAIGSDAEWRRFGRPCWDDYCNHADVYRAWITHPSAPTWSAVAEYFHTGLHSNSPVGPLLSALIGAGTGLSTVNSYRLLMGLATLCAVAISWFWLFPKAEVEVAVRLPTLVLLATSMVVVRSALFPQTDALIMFWTAAVLGLALDRTRLTRRWHLPVGLALFVSGLLVKLSFVPALALVPIAGVYRLWAARHVGGIRPGHAAGRLMLEVLLYVVVPLAAFRAFQVAVGSTQTYTRELAATSTGATWAPFLVETFLQASFFFLLLFAVGLGRRRPVDAVLLGWAALYVVALLVTRASGFDRYYLALIPLLAILASRGLSWIADRGGPTLVWGVVGTVAALNYLALVLGLYF